MSTLSSRLRGLAATLALVVVVAGVPVILLAIEAVPDLRTLSWSRLTSPDDGTLVVEILGAICWIAWAVFTCQVMASISSQVRGSRTPRLPGLAMPQLAADRLVAAAALLFIAVPSATALVPQPKATAVVASAPFSDETPEAVASVAEPAIAAAPVGGAERAAEAKVEQYTVKRGDSLWRIAEDRLGGGARFVELVQLNHELLDGRPDFLLPGTILRVPIVEADSAGAYIVQPGDTLSEIAESELGHADSYPAIFKASRHIVQDDGGRLTDPDLILPGWTVDIPGHERAVESPVSKPVPPPDPPESPITPPMRAPDSEPSVQQERHPDNSEPSADDNAPPSWLLPGLAGAGAVFGGALWLVLRAQRRTQLRHRRPGTIIPPPPAELVATEKTAHATASAVSPQIEALDGALRSVPSLRLVKAVLTPDEIHLTFHEPAALTPPWLGSGTTWRIGLSDLPDHPEDSFPPYPLLVSVGQALDGSFTFLNLEELRTVTVTGDSHRKAGFARHLAAELAVNPWSAVTTIDLVGLGSDLASFNLGRVHTHPPGDIDFVDELVGNLSSLTETADPDDFHAVIITSEDSSDPAFDELAKTIEAIPGRASAAVMSFASGPRAGGCDLHLTTDGRLKVLSLGVDVHAAELSPDEARACALLLDLTLDDQVVSVPQPKDDAAVSDLAGALSERLTENRPDHGAAGHESLLPLDVRIYADVAATTADDVKAVAPKATIAARAIVETADPSLDDDLARWESPTLSTAKLTLLGPVGARTTGDTKATAHRRPFYVELLAYLTLHPRGVSARDVADDFGLRPERVRVDMSQLRRWLGTNSQTGEPFLPRAEPGNGPGSPALYTLHGVMSDLELFRRLRARGQSRGSDGIEDLIAALRMVSGEPFTKLREGHWNWLLDGDRWDHIMTSAIVDVGHVVAAHALASGDPDLALWAAQVAYAAAPYDEVAQLDLVQAEAATGDHEQAAKDLANNVIDRRDDGLPPIGLPERTARMMRDKSWGDRASDPRRTG